jgi:hypothetical protein
MDIRTEITTAVPENTTPLLTGVFNDEAGDNIDENVLDAATLKIYDHTSGTLIRSVDLLATNAITNGTFQVRLTSNDTAIVSQTLRFGEEEKRIVLAEWTWTASFGGESKGKHEIVFPVRKLRHIESEEE